MTPPFYAPSPAPLPLPRMPLFGLLVSSPGSPKRNLGVLFQSSITANPGLISSVLLSRATSRISVVIKGNGEEI